MLLSRETAIHIMQRLGYGSAGAWDENKLERRVNSLHKVIEEEFSLGVDELDDVLSRLLSASANDEWVSISTDAESTDAESTDAKSTDAKSTDAESTNAESTDVESTDAESTDVESTDAEPTGVESVELVVGSEVVEDNDEMPTMMDGITLTSNPLDQMRPKPPKKPKPRKRNAREERYQRAKEMVRQHILRIGEGNKRAYANEGMSAFSIIINALLQSSQKKPISKIGIFRLLVILLPKRSPDALWDMLRVQSKTVLEKKGYILCSNGQGGFWAVPKNSKKGVM